MAESFWRFTDPAVAKKWLKQFENKLFENLNIVTL